MEIRKAKVEEYEDIKIIYLRAREFMVSEGNLTQWANIDQILNKVLKDIRAGHCYVCTENDVLLGVFCFFIGEEPTYNKIYNGEWLNDKPYGFIHRIAVAVYQKGFGTKCIEWCLNQYPNVRIDTHKDNIPMQKTVLKLGFRYCGIIKLENGDERWAYQWEKNTGIFCRTFYNIFSHQWFTACKKYK